MTRSLTAGLVVLAVCLVVGALPAGAGDFDGSRTLLCAPSDAMACNPGLGCEYVTIEDVGLPRFLRVEFDKKRLVAIGNEDRTSPIETVRKDEATTIVQGGQAGRGWSLVVDQANGLMSASIAESGGAFAVFGACMAR